jgi:hypothetical protein
MKRQKLIKNITSLTLIFAIVVTALIGGMIGMFKQNRYSASPFTVSADSLTDIPPSDMVTREYFIQNADGTSEKLKVMKGIGLFATADGTPIASIKDGSSIIGYDPTTGGITCGDPNEVLRIFLDSHIDNNKGGYLLKRRDGAVGVKKISLKDTVYLITYKDPKTHHVKDIWATKEIKRNGGNWFSSTWNGIIGKGNSYEQWYDMAGQELDFDNLISHESSAFWKNAVKAATFIGTGIALGTLINPILGLVLTVAALSTIILTKSYQSLVEIKDKTTLMELLEYISHATEHPYDTLIDESGQPVKTQDGLIIYVNPSNNQLVDYAKYPLYDTKTLLSPILYGDRVVTVENDGKSTLKDVEYKDGKLVNISSTQRLLETDFNLYLYVFDNTDLGISYTNVGTRNKDGEIITLDGTPVNTLPFIRPTFAGDMNTDQSFGDWLKSLFGGLGGNKIKQAITIIIIVFLCLMFSPIIIALLFLIFYLIKSFVGFITRKINKI